MKLLTLLLIPFFFSCQHKQNNKPFSIGDIFIGQKIENVKGFHDFKIIPDKGTSEFDSIYTISKYFINKEFGTVENLELIIENHRIFSIHFRSGQFTNRENIKIHFDTTLVYKYRTKDSISDIYESKSKKPIYSYISYFDDYNLYHYTDQIDRMKYRETQLKEINTKYINDLKKENMK